MAMAEYYVAVNGRLGHRKQLHTERDCPKLQRAENSQPADREQHPNKDVCDVCAGSWSPVHETDETHACEVCGREYETPGGLGRHVMREHPEIVEERLTTDQRKVVA